MKRMYLKPKLKITIRKNGVYLMAGSQSPWAESKSSTFEDFEDEETLGRWHNIAWD